MRLLNNPALSFPGYYVSKMTSAIRKVTFNAKISKVFDIWLTMGFKFKMEKVTTNDYLVKKKKGFTL